MKKILALCVLCCLQLYFCRANKNLNSNSGSINPYHVLGIAKDAPQDEVKKKYRSLCLKYHPDKNVNSSEEEREKCEKAFKQIQEANSLIGSAEDRKKYEHMIAFEQRFGRSRSSQQQQQTSAEVFQRYFQRTDPFNPTFQTNGYAGAGSGGGMGPAGQRFPHRASRRRFYVNGVDISHLFKHGSQNGGRNGMNPFSNGSNSATTSDQSGWQERPKSIFVEKVTVPLEELYAGVNQKEFTLDDSIFQRYQAAFRGGVASQIALQGLLTSIPLLLRSSWPVSFLCFLATVHISLPRPMRLSYVTSLKAGWKGGTKLKFIDSQPGIDVIFVIDEGKHDRFKRDGNDLATTIVIGKTKARKGCTLFIEPLADRELPIMVKLKPGEVFENRHIVTVKGKGWPKTDGSGKGDLHITVSVVSDTRAERWKRRKKRTTN